MSKDCSENSDNPAEKSGVSCEERNISHTIFTASVSNGMFKRIKSCHIPSGMTWFTMFSDRNICLYQSILYIPSIEKCALAQALLGIRPQRCQRSLFPRVLINIHIHIIKVKTKNGEQIMPQCKRKHPLKGFFKGCLTRCKLNLIKCNLTSL